MKMTRTCPECNAVLMRANECLQCGWPKKQELKPVLQHCHFSNDGQCKGKVTVRVNQSWLCQWHYENYYDHLLRTGEKIQAHELKFKKRLDEVNTYVRCYQADHPNATKKEACFAYLREFKLTHLLPKEIQEAEVRKRFEEKR